MIVRSQNRSESLKLLRWSARTWGKPITLHPAVEVRLFEMPDSPSNLGIALIVNKRRHERVLVREHVETRGRSTWFRDNCWRLTDAGVEYFAPGIESVLHRLENANDPSPVPQQTDQGA